VGLAFYFNAVFIGFEDFKEPSLLNSSFITAFCRGTLTEPPPTKVEGFSGLERLRRTVEIFSD
jgi:hypothetical protein